MEGYPNWVDSGCGCLVTVSATIFLALLAAIVLLRGVVG